MPALALGEVIVTLNPVIDVVVPLIANTPPLVVA